MSSQPQLPNAPDNPTVLLDDDDPTPRAELSPHLGNRSSVERPCCSRSRRVDDVNEHLREIRRARRRAPEIVFREVAFAFLFEGPN